MDSIRAQKHQAMRNYNNAGFYVINVVVYSVAVLLSSLAYLFLFWFPSINHIFSIYVPNMRSTFLSSKSLFILANVIIAILIGNSKLRSGNSKSTLGTEVYNEYVERSRHLSLARKRRTRSCTSTHNMEAEGLVPNPWKTTTSYDSLPKIIQEVHVDPTPSPQPTNPGIINAADSNDIVDEINELGSQASSESESCNGKGEDKKAVERLQRDELKRRAEEFIARVYRRRMVEAREVVLFGD